MKYKQMNSLMKFIIIYPINYRFLSVMDCWELDLVLNILLTISLWMVIVNFSPFLDNYYSKIS